MRGTLLRGRLLDNFTLSEGLQGGVIELDPIVVQAKAAVGVTRPGRSAPRMAGRALGALASLPLRHCVESPLWLPPTKANGSSNG